MRHTWSVVTAALLAIVVAGSEAAALTLTVQGSDNGPVGHYRWLVEEDNTHPVTIGALVADSLGVSIHNTYAPVVAAGSSDDLSPITSLSPTGRYYISIRPDTDYGMGGGMIAAGQSAATIIVNHLPIPTAQMLVFVFEDIKSISGAAEIPAEHGLANFSIRIDEILGHQVWDVFGNPLGTTYVEPLPTDGSPPTVDVLGNGINTGPDGYAIIKNIPPGNYKVTARPRDGQPWKQTTAVGGGPFIPVVVKAGEPPFLDQGLGNLNMHVALGFVRPFNDLAPGTGTITGRCVNEHSPHPPSAVIIAGTPVTDCLVGLNSVEAGTETGKYFQPANPDGTFTILNVPAGAYQLALVDEALDNLISNYTLDVPDGGTVALGDALMARWTSTFEGSVFRDDNADGIRDPGEPGIAGTTINIRFPDASIIQSTQTDDAGNFLLPEVPPLGEWTIAEVDYARNKVTGATFSADQGSDLPPDVHTETQGLVLLEAQITQANQVNHADFGKKAYGPGPDNVFNTADDENGGIVGITYYATTRAEDDPYLGVGDPWEPGIPRVQENLYLDANHDAVIDDLDGDGIVTLADVDNFPYQWSRPDLPGYTGAPGPEDVDRPYAGHTPGAFDPGDAVAITISDGFNDLAPTGCAGAPQFVHNLPIQDCAADFFTWNQMRPGAFDGGFYFPSFVPGGLANVAGGIPNWGGASIPLRNGVYILEAVPPPGYEITKEEDKNVTIGDTHAPSPQALLFPCVGDAHLVPPVLSGDGATPGFYANQVRPLCDRKQVTVTPGLNANCDFFLFTQVPKAGRIVGEVQNLLANQTNPNTPNFGGPQTPPWMPISIQDYAGHEISRVYTDEFGEFNALVPGSNSPHVPQPSGLASNVVNLCINHPGPIDLGAGPVTDPQYDPNYDQPCYRAESIQGKTTYAITPVTAISAFVAAPTGLDCELPDHSPVIAQVIGGPSTTTGSNITITSPGSVVIPDPNDPSGVATITRDYGFGSSAGRVTVGGADLGIVSWASDGLSITASVPLTGVTTGELLVHRADGTVTVTGVTLSVNDAGPFVNVPSGGSIQAAIDGAPVNALVLVPPGTYHENLIISKPIRLQGYGAYSTIIDASVFPERRDAWRAKLAALVTGNLVDLVPGQRADLSLEDGAGITVLAKDGAFTSSNRARIDGFTVMGAVRGGGVFVNGYAHYLEISNNRLQANQGSQGGGIRLGWQSLVNDTNTGYVSAANDHLAIHHNHLIRNGSLGDGGGILIFNGADHYAITANRFCGNYGAANGGAISHFGLSDQGLIAENQMFMNEGFGEGGGIATIGEFVPTGAPLGFLSEGTGTITIDSNLIQSNYGGDDGGGITMFSTSGQDIATHPGDPAHWYHIDIVNNIITNNVCGFSGAGIAMSDAVGVRVVHNTITHNDSTSVANFTNGSVTLATPMSGGIIARPNSPDLAAASGQPFTNPVLANNIIWHNRSFVYDATLNGGLGGLFVDPASPYWDLQVFGMPAGTRLDPRSCLLSEDLASGDPHNPTATPYHASNIYPSDAKLLAPFDNSIEVTPNVLTPLVSPLSPIGNYHIDPTSPAVGNAGAVAGNFGTLLAADFDADVRPNGVADIGADEVPPGAPSPSDTVGPKIRDLLASPNPTGGASTVSVTATAYDTATGGSSVTAAEWWTSLIPAHTPIVAGFGAMEVGLAFTVPVTTSTDFTVFVRAKDAFNNWGETASILVQWSASTPADTVGPSINALKADPNPSNGAPTTTVTATVFDTLSGNANVDAAEYWTAAIAPPPGSGTPMTAADGSFNSSAEKVTVTIPAAGPDFFVHVRGHDAAGNWGAPATIQVRVTPGNSGTGPGRGIFIQCPGDADGDAVIDAAVVPPAGPYSYPSNTRCKSLTAGDGHIVMGDLRPIYTLGFSDITGVPPDQAMATGVSAANFPAPKIVVDEDDDFYLNLTNVGMATRPDLFDPHTVHWHGFPNAAAIFDGLPDASIGIGMGSTLTYFYHVKEPGTYMYHCHQEAAEHMQMGMLGNLYVRPKQNRLPDGYCFTTHTVGPCAAAATHHNPDYNVNRNLDNPEIGDKYAYDDGDGSSRYDVDYAIQIGSMDPNFHDLHEAVQPLPFSDMRDLYPMLNGRGYPDTINPASIANPDGHLSQNDSSKITATPGQKILVRISNLNVTRYYTLATLGIPMKVVGFNARLFRSPSTNNGTTPGKTLAYTTNSVTLGGGETVDVILDTAGVPNGTSFLYTTNLNYLTNNEEEFGGMMTEITVAP